MGRRVGRGRGTKAQTEFRRRHRPWSGTQWRVTLTLTLDSGRRLRLEHDLQAGSVRVQDADTDRFLPVSFLERELGIPLETDGGFDGARMLGLSRDAVRSTMFVGQADVLGVLHNAEELQEHLQRAASSARLDTTAEEALEWIAEQRRERVGVLYVGNRPLRATIADLDAAREALGAAIDARHALRALQVEQAAAQELLARRDADVRALKVSVEWLALDDLGTRIDRAGELGDRITALSAEPAPADEESVARVTTAVEAYKARGAAPEPADGRTAAELQQEIDLLPVMPEGPRQPDPTAVAAERRLGDAEAALLTLTSNAPQLVENRDVEATPDEIRVLAQHLAEPPPVLAPGVRSRIQDLTAGLEAARAAHARSREMYEAALATYAKEQTRYESSRHDYEQADAAYWQAYTLYRADVEARDAAEHEHTAAQQAYAQALAEQDAQISGSQRSRAVGSTLLASGGAALVAAVVSLLIGAAPAAVVLVLIGLGAIVPGIVVFTRRAKVEPRPGPPAPLAAAPVRPEPQRPTPPEPPRAPAADLPADPPAAPLALIEAERELDRWEDTTRQHAARRDAAVQRIADLGMPEDAARLRELARGLDDRDAAQERYSRHVEQLAAGEAAVSDAVRVLIATLGVTADRAAGGADEARAAMARYVQGCAERDRLARSAERRTDLLLALDERIRREAEHDRALQFVALAESELISTATELGLDYSDAATAIAGLERWLVEQRRLGDVSAEVRTVEARREQLLDGSSVAELRAEVERRALEAGPRPEHVDPSAGDRLQAAEQRRDTAAADVARIDGQLRETEKSLPSVAEAMEREALADRTAERVRELDGCLALAARHLEIAKDRAHADIAPVLERTIRPWVPRVTDGRFADIDIDAASLMVRAVDSRGGVRDADVLSQGTMEQLFLLLRIALAEHLSSSTEIAPIVLDDVTVQSDRRRKEAILSLLHEISGQRQVVVFTQELEVVSWGIHHLPEGSVIGL